MEKTWKIDGKVGDSMQTHQDLFRNVPPDELHLFSQNGEPNAEKVVGLLNYKKQDVAKAANVPLGSIRYDAKMPEELRQRLKEWAIAINLVATFFKDQQRTLLWFQTTNPLLGEQSPRDMIRLGRFKKLFRFINTALAENSK